MPNTITLNQQESSYLQTLINGRFQDANLRAIEGILQLAILGKLEENIPFTVTSQQNGWLQYILKEAYEISGRVVSTTGGSPSRKPYTPFANQNNNFNLLQLIVGISNKVIEVA